MQNPQNLQWPSKPLHLSQLRTENGASEGTKLGYPTVNIEPSQFPSDMPEGIYAVRVTIDDHRYLGALHYGHRPVFDNAFTAEVHVLDTELHSLPSSINIEVVSRMREVRNFKSPLELQKQIAKDIEEVHAILSA